VTLIAVFPQSRGIMKNRRCFPYGVALLAPCASGVAPASTCR